MSIGGIIRTWWDHVSGFAEFALWLMRTVVQH